MNKEKSTEWTTPSTIKKLLLRRFNRGDFLRDSIVPALPYPLEITLKYPQGRALGDNFGKAMAWAKLYRTGSDAPPYTVEWSQINFREVGRNSIPVKVMFEDAEKVAQFINKRKSCDLFSLTSGELLDRFPKLTTWVYNKPFLLLELAPVLSRLIRVTEWILNHPRPAIYLRQISIPQIDTKFIEKHKKVLGEWLDILLDSSQIDTMYSGVKNFEQRYGFLSKQPIIRFRILDPALYIVGLSDIALPADQFCALDLDTDEVFVTENDINGLCFPPLKRAMVIFGRGYGFDYLADAHWIRQKRIWYWGDIDTHGFAILNQFRTFFPDTQSFLMDYQTLTAHRDHWVEEKTALTAKLDNLSEQENALYEDLIKGRMGKAVRLEQELIQYEYVWQALNDRLSVLD